jgi:hypothetical protein
VRASRAAGLWRPRCPAHRPGPAPPAAVWPPQKVEASEFFWFHKPKVIAYLFNWAYYENSLSLALVLFSLVLVSGG